MPKKGFTDETKLIFCCARTEMDTPILRSLQEALCAPLDWKYIAEQSRYHGISPLLYYNLNKIHRQNIPGATFTILKNSYYATLAKNMYLWKEFCCIQDMFNKAGIKVIPLKGIIFSDTLYHNLGLRPMIDIDILVQEKDLLSAKNELLRLGYKIYLKNLPENYWKRHHCHFQFHNLDKNVALELHWAFAPPRPDKIGLTEAWQRARYQKIDNQEVLTLSPEDTLLSLCINMCRNIPNLQFVPLKNLVDINELILQHGGKLDLDYLKNRFAEWKLRGAFFYVHSLTERFLKTHWPDKLISRIPVPVMQRGILSLCALEEKKRTQFQAITLMLLTTDGFSDAIRIALKLTVQTFSIFIQNKKVFALYLKR